MWVACIPAALELGMFFGGQKQGYHLKVVSLKTPAQVQWEQNLDESGEKA